MVAQLTYGSTTPIALPGMIAEPFGLHQIDSWLAGVDIPFGTACSVSPTDPKQVVITGAAPADKFVGISVFAQQLNVQDILTGAVSYKHYDQLPVISNGRVWVKAVVAVAFGEQAYAMADGSGFTNVPTGNVSVGGKFLGVTTGPGQLVLLSL